MNGSVYIHIPFCKSKCKYCSFYSIPQVDLVDVYVSALLKEINYYYNKEALKTLYFGGGTPSLLSTETISKILSNFNISPNTEVTFEINPDDANSNYLKELFSLGINRLSFGAQSFDDKILKYIGRRHSSKDILKAIENSRKSGFDNISLDLIYGLPFQTMDILQNDLEVAISTEIKHVSTYGLKIESPSYFYKNPPESLPDDDLQADMYLGVNIFLENIGFKRYEISNFAKKGFESKHNLNYWNNSEYYGFGASAHGYLDGIRYSNSNEIKDYIANPLNRKTEHMVTKQEQLEEEIFLGLRREIGINIKEINQKFNIDFDTKYSEILKKYIPKYLVPTENGYKFTLCGVLLSNNILADFIDV